MSSLLDSDRSVADVSVHSNLVVYTRGTSDFGRSVVLGPEAKFGCRDWELA